jgi:uncharacterized membrane protein YccC
MTNTAAGKSIRAITFVVRCSGVATVAYEAALWLGLPEPIWAVIPGLIVSQERLRETRLSLTGYVLGTLLGIVVTIAVREAASYTGGGIAMQMAAGVAISALAAHKFPQVRAAMWTCPLILLTAPPSEPIVIVALHRGGEVLLGVVVGWIFHWAAEALFGRLTGRCACSADREGAHGPPPRQESTHRKRHGQRAYLR